jgi:hypothetical protein
MLLATPSHGHTTKIKVHATSHGFPMTRPLGSLSGSTSVPSGSSSSLVIDNQGQAHDPGYLDALRQLHAEIGNSATSSKQTYRRRLSPSSATTNGLRRPRRPSNLGLGLASNMAALDIGSDSSDDDDDDQQDLDPYDSLFEEARRHDAMVNRSLRSPAVLSSASISPASTPTSAFAPIPSPVTSFGASRSGTPRHTSFSTHADFDLAHRSRQPHWSSRRLSSPHQQTVTPLSSASSRPPLPQFVSNTNDGWGFTGIVDVERERANSELRNRGDVSPGLMANLKLTTSLLDDTPYTTPSAPDSPKLVAAASQNRSKASQSNLALPSASVDSASSTMANCKLRQMSTSQGRSKSLLKKNSTNDLPSSSISPPSSTDGMGVTIIEGESGSTRRKSSLSNVHPPPTQSPSMTRTSSLRRKFGVGSRKGSSRSRPNSSGAASTHTVSDAERVRDFHTGGNFDGNDTSLSTILSGKQMVNNGGGSEFTGHSTAPSMAFSGSARSSSMHDSSSRPSLSSLHPEEREMLERQVIGDGDDTIRGSRLRDGLDDLKRRGADVVDVGTHSYELRRKMELLAMGLRFNAFKAKKKLERGLKHHEA